MIINTS